MINGACKGLQQLLLLALVAILGVTAVAQPAFAYHHRRHSHSSHHRRSSAPEPNRYAAIVLDADTGYVFSEKDADVRRYPASLSKMMTLYLVFEALENGSVTKNQRLMISANAQYQSPSKLGLLEGYTIRLEDAIYGVVTRSANDAAVTLAEGIGGSEARFARLMTAKAQALGMRGTHFVNATGLHDPQQYSTARDISILARALVRDFPREYRYFSTPSFTFAGITSVNHNHLMASYYGMDGIKTGYVNASGYNLAASAVRNGHRVIGIIFGGRTASSRNRAMAMLLDSAFERLKDPRVLAYIEQRRRSAGHKPVQTAALAEETGVRTSASYQAAAMASGGEGDANEPQGRQTAGEDEDRQPGAAGHSNAPANPYAANEAGAETPRFQPRPLNTAALGNPAGGQTAAEQLTQQPPAASPQRLNSASPQRLAAADIPPRPPAAGTWAIQIGAYSSHDAGLMALRDARGRLPQRITDSSKYLIVPLMTNRGMIYRARMAGLDRQQAATACKVLKGSCVILAVE